MLALASACPDIEVRVVDNGDQIIGALKHGAYDTVVYDASISNYTPRVLPRCNSRGQTWPRTTPGYAPRYIPGSRPCKSVFGVGGWG